MPKVYTVCYYLQIKKLSQVSGWTSDCLVPECIKPAESEWRLFQVESEYLYKNILSDEFEEIMKKCDEFFEIEYDKSMSPAENMQKFIKEGQYNLPNISFKGTVDKPEYATTLIRLEAFREMLANSQNFLKTTSPLSISKQYLIDNLSTKESAERFSQKMEDNGVKLKPSNGPPYIFWISDATEHDKQTYINLSEEDLSVLIEASGLNWRLDADGKLDVVMVRVPLKELKELQVPTVFHGNKYFKPNKNAVIDWGRTVDKRTRTSKTGLPELMHKVMPWKSSFQIYYAGYLTKELIHFFESDWKLLLANS